MLPALDHSLLTGDAQDGILVYDNPVPNWWKFIFVSCILFGVSILFVLRFRTTRSLGPRPIQRSLGECIGSFGFKEIGDLPADRATILEYMNDKPEWLAVGKATYQANCVSCHGPNGGGLVGPNLTDDYWKNVRSVDGIAKVLENGAGNGAMPAWKTRFSHPNQIVLTAAYVASLRKNPVKGKGPEGGEKFLTGTSR